MQYILTQDELDELKNKPCVQEVLDKLSEYLIMGSVCVDVLVGPIYVSTQESFKTAVEKTIEYYAKNT